MAAGKLNERLTIQRATVTHNDYNEEIESWSDLVTVWAGRRDASAGESYRAREVGSQITARFTIRQSSEVADVNPRDRISYDGRTYNITGVREADRNRMFEIDAVARSETEAADA